MISRLRARHTSRTADSEADTSETSDTGGDAAQTGALRSAARRLQYSSEVTESDLETIRSAVESEDPDARRRATSALAGVPSTSRSKVVALIPPLVDCLDDEQLSVRRNSAKALGQIAAADRATVRDHAPELAEHLTAYNSWLSGGVATALAEAAKESPDDVAPLVFPYLDSGVRYIVRHNALLVLQNAATASHAAVEPVIPDLVDLLDQQSSDQHRVLHILATVADEFPDLVAPAVPELLSYATEGAEEERQAAVEILSQIAVAEPTAVRPAVPVLTRHLTEESPAHRERAARALVEIASRCPAEQQTVLDVLAETETMGAWRGARRIHATETDVGRKLAERALADSSLSQFLDES